jgi:hypothetical protein
MSPIYHQQVGKSSGETKSQVELPPIRRIYQLFRDMYHQYNGPFPSLLYRLTDSNVNVDVGKITSNEA